MENLNWFQSWYSKKAIEQVGNDLNIVIKTTKNSSWLIEIDLTFIKPTKEKIFNENKISDFNWFYVQIYDNKFKAEGDFTKLEFLLSKFSEYIGDDKKEKTYVVDNFLNQQIQDFIFENDDEAIIYLHYTYNKKVAQSILENGFEFVSPFDNTTSLLKKDNVVINFNHYVRKAFGDYVIVICIEKEMFNYYLNEVKKYDNKYTEIEELLTTTPSFVNDDNEKIFTLHKSFVKGYFNYYTKELVANPDYNFKNNLAEFHENLEKVKN